MAEEVRIVATLDTTDVVSGTRRIENATREMKRVVGDAVKVDPGKAEEAGGKAGQDFTRGFVAKLLIRDAIRGVFEAITLAGKELSDLTGVNINLDVWQKLADIITNIALQVGVINKAVAAEATSKILDLNQERKDIIAIDRGKRDPLSFNRSSKDIENEIERIRLQENDEKIRNQRLRLNRADSGARGFKTDEESNRTAGADITDEELKRRNAQHKERLSILREELQVAKEKEALVNRNVEKRAMERKKITEDEFRLDDKKQRDFEQSIEKSMATARRFEKQRIAEEKREKRADLENAEEDLHGKRKIAESDLRSEEGNLSHLKATSAVRIGGAMFGRNDSAASLVNHAAQQVNLLRSIDAELKDIKQQRINLTLQ